MNIQTINQSIQKQKEQLLNHSLYNKVKTIDDLHCFFKTIIYAVWDFMSLLKALQIKLTCTTTPWLPIGNPEIRYLINEIVVAEETDLTLDGTRQSHFEMYLDAMTNAALLRTQINAFFRKCRRNKKHFCIDKTSNLPPK
jgi:hypothetical protein